MTSSVLFVCEQGDSSCAWARAHLPGMGLAKRGWTVYLSHWMFQQENGVIQGAMPDKKGVLTPLPVTTHVVMRRINDMEGKMISNASMIAKARMNGQKIYIDIDDDAWNLPEWNPAFKDNPKRTMAVWGKDMGNATGVLVTTEALGLSVTDHVQNTHVYVCPNMVETSLFKPSMEWPHNPLRLGWMGTTDFRGHDLDMVVDALREVLDGRFGEVEFWHLGSRSDLPSVHELLRPGFPVQVREIPWQRIVDVGKMIADIDVAIIPMVKHPFNEARSNISGLNYMAAGIPFVASDTVPYRQLWRMGGGYTAQWSHEAWTAALNMLVAPEYEDYRRDSRLSGTAVAARFKPELGTEAWEVAFR